jgi:hypothetical protein
VPRVQIAELLISGWSRAFKGLETFQPEERGVKMTFLLVTAFYGLIGLSALFVGPAARLRRYEVQHLALHAGAIPAWKLAAFHWLLGAGIVLLWPALVISAARKEGRLEVLSEIGSARTEVAERTEPSAQLSAIIVEIRQRFGHAIPYAQYRDRERALPWNERAAFERALDEFGCVIADLAEDAQGRSIAVTIGVANQLGLPIRLIERSIKPAENGWSDGDGAWNFASSPDSWQILAGRSGIAWVRGNVVAGIMITRMN